MAKRFGSPVSDGKESSKASTEWVIRVWNDWSSIRGSSDSTDRAPVDTPLLEMPWRNLVTGWESLFSKYIRKRMG